jgi:5-methylcytosine-specific restriction endonuclease McrA
VETKKSYAEKLKDPRWQKMRLQILERDNWMCQHCFATEKTLHVHHLAYAKGREPWDYPKGHLLTLCSDCHEAMPSEQSAYEAKLLENFRLKAKGPFDKHTVTAVFDRYEEVAYLFYLLWNNMSAQDDVIKALEEIRDRIEEGAEAQHA